MAGSRKRRRKAGRTRRILAATLCAASFLTGHLVFGADGAPSRLSQYAAARQDLSGAPPEQYTGLKPAAVVPAEDTTSVMDATDAKLAPIVAGGSAASGRVPLIAAKPLPLGASSVAKSKSSPAADDAGLPPIVSAASMPRPSQRKAVAAPAIKTQFAPAPIFSGDATRQAAARRKAAETPSLPGMQLNQFVAPQPATAQPKAAYPVTNSARSPLPNLLPQARKIEPVQIAPAFAPVAAEMAGDEEANATHAAAYEQPDTRAVSEMTDAQIAEDANSESAPITAPRVLTVQTPADEIELGLEPAEQSFEPTARLKSPPVLPGSLAPILTPRALGAAVMPAADTALTADSEEESTTDREEVRSTDFTASASRALSSQPAEAMPSDDPVVEFGKIPEGSPFEAITQSGTINLQVRRSLLMRTKVDVYRTAIVDDSIVELAQFTPREVSLIGRSRGQTHVTFWFDDPNMQPVTYLVNVAIDEEAIKADENKYKLLESVVNEMFPDSKVYLVLVADKLLVKGQARDSEEAAQIMSIIRAQSSGYGGPAGYNGLTQGAATPVLSMSATGNNPGPAYTIINMLRVPGVQQVALRVKIAELNRTAARGFGVDIAGQIDLSAAADGSKLFLASLLNASSGGGTALIAQVDGDDLNIGIRYAQQRGVIRLLSEPTLVTLSGQPATFIAGGEFAVPTVVGSVGLNAVTTDFRAFGAIISFLPTIVDKDRIRLQVAPEFSQINSTLAVGGTPGLNVRAATTTVEMREGQTLAIAGLLEDTYKGTTVGDLPFLAQIFGRRDASHNETELIILVTPELVQPMEPEEVPPLPGFDVTEPNACEFFLHGDIEGNPTRDHRSTVWPRLRKRYGMGGPAMTSGPFGHGQ